MPTMYELTENYLKLLELANDPEIDPEMLTDTFEMLDDDIEVKAENTAVVMQELAGDVEKLKAEEQRLKTRRQAIENHIDSLRRGLYTAMKTTGKTKFKTMLFSFNIQKNGGKIPVIVDVDCSELPDDLVMITEKPNLDALREYLEKNPESTLAHFGERGESLRIK